MRGSDTFSFIPPMPNEVTISISRKVVRETLAEVRNQLLRHDINGGGKKFNMTTVCDSHNTCGTAACIGGWASIFLIGFEGTIDYEEQAIVRRLFDKLHSVYGRRLHDLFYDFDETKNYNQPNVAATAIQRYLDGERTVWPKGDMPNVLRYKAAKRKKKPAAKK